MRRERCPRKGRGDTSTTPFSIANGTRSVRQYVDCTCTGVTSALEILHPRKSRDETSTPVTSYLFTVLIPVCRSYVTPTLNLDFQTKVSGVRYGHVTGRTVPLLLLLLQLLLILLF